MLLVENRPLTRAKNWVAESVWVDRKVSQVFSSYSKDNARLTNTPNKKWTFAFWIYVVRARTAARGVYQLFNTAFGYDELRFSGNCFYSPPPHHFYGIRDGDPTHKHTCTHARTHTRKYVQVLSHIYINKHLSIHSHRNTNAFYSNTTLCVHPRSVT